jgi:hypothetical protein
MQDNLIICEKACSTCYDGHPGNESRNLPCRHSRPHLERDMENKCYGTGGECSVKGWVKCRPLNAWEIMSYKIDEKHL